MDIVGLRPVNQGWNTGIEAEETIVGRARRGLVLERGAEHRLVRFGQDLTNFLMVLEHERLGLEALPAYRRRVVAEERIVGRRLADQILDLLPALLEGLRRQHAHAHVESAPGWHRARPVA